MTKQLGIYKKKSLFCCSQFSYIISLFLQLCSNWLILQGPVFVILMLSANAGSTESFTVCCKAESNGTEAKVVDGHASWLTFMPKTVEENLRTINAPLKALWLLHCLLGMHKKLMRALRLNQNSKIASCKTKTGAERS